MIHYRKILEGHFKGMTQRTISSSYGSSRNTTSEVIKRAKEHGIISLSDQMSDQWIEEYLFPEKQAIEKGYYPANWETIHKELQRKNVTLKLLFEEYELVSRQAGKIPYSYRSFTRKYGNYAKKYKATLPIRRKPGEIMEVDWAGSTLAVMDRASGENLRAYIFVANLPYSQYFYVEAFLDMKSQNWLMANIHAFEYFDGVTETVVPDNLKTGVTKHSKNEEPLLNEAYRELGDYYHTVIVPSRVRTPKDKASVEGTVGFVSRQVIASLRNYQCFDLRDLNQRIWEKMTELNTIKFQKRPGSRKSAFEDEEKSHLQPLPQTRFTLSEWRVAKVQLNYRIQVDHQYYSVPYEYIQCEVEVRLTRDLVEVYLKEIRIASHRRIYGEVGQYVTNPDHMPDNHRLYLDHTIESCQEWAKGIGEHLLVFVNFISEHQVEKKALNQLMLLRKLSRDTSNQVLEEAAESLLSISSQPSLSVFKSLLARQKRREKAQQTGSLQTLTDAQHGFVRGAKYFEEK